MAKKEICFEEARPGDAEAFLAFMNIVSRETDFLVLPEEGLSFSTQEIERILETSLASYDQLILLAKVDEEIIGVLSLRSFSQYRISHIGNLFLAVKKTYWGYGVGTILLEELLEWVRQNGHLKRLELTVQVRNQRAVHLYQKMGFEIEGTQKRGARTDKGEWLDLYYMGQLIEDK